MCQDRNPDLPLAASPTALIVRPDIGVGKPSPPPPTGTRRRRLWDLDRHAHCPLLGVCIPIAALRRLVGKVAGSHASSVDYELHIGTVAQCRTRNRMSEALQKHLDQRFELVVRRACSLKTAEALADWWSETSAGHDLPGALWATLTHPRCDAELESAPNTWRP